MSKYNITEKDAQEFTFFIEKGYQRFHEKHNSEDKIFADVFATGFAQGMAETAMEMTDDSLYEISTRLAETRLSIIKDESGIRQANNIYEQYKSDGNKIKIKPAILLLLLNKEEREELKEFLFKLEENKAEDKEKTQEIINENREALGEPACYEILAEESAELTQAALKVARILRNDNPTPVSLKDAKANVIEELTDVSTCCKLLQIQPDEEIEKRKAYRTKNRIAEKNNTND